ncbi:MAG: hypothetical protein V4850_10975 [Myxococcota bacterium]
MDLSLATDRPSFDQWVVPVEDFVVTCETLHSGICYQFTAA